MSIAIVSGALANKPANGGNAWTRLQWVLGLRRLGFEVYFVEQIARATASIAAGRSSAFRRAATANISAWFAGDLGSRKLRP